MRLVQCVVLIRPVSSGLIFADETDASRWWNKEGLSTGIDSVSFRKKVVGYGLLSRFKSLYSIRALGNHTAIY